ncbi:hypothetical protein ACOSQ2_017319 [Xanthoceras sorbifolium]
MILHQPDIRGRLIMEIMQTDIIFITLSISILLYFTFNLFFSTSKTTTKTKLKLPPGPSTFGLIANFIWHRKTISELGPIVSNLHNKYGPIMTVYLGSQANVLIADNNLAYQALVQKGAVFGGRPDHGTLVKKIFPSSMSNKTIALSPYGPTWRVLRRNLIGMEGILYPSRLKSYSHIRKRVLDNLFANLNRESKHGQGVSVREHFRHAIFSFLFLLCFGDNIDESKIQEFEATQSRFSQVLPRLVKAYVLAQPLWKIVFKNIWNELQDVLLSIENLFGSFIRERKKIKQDKEEGRIKSAVSYIDTLLEVDVHDGNDEISNLDEADILSLCLEFINPGTDSTSTALQWIMANVVKYPGIQAKIFDEMNQVVEQGQEWINEDDLQKLPYLKAVILEGLRRHPPVNLVTMPHMVTEDVELDGYIIPKGTPVYFWIPNMGRDPNLWEDPIEFKPERFLLSDNDKNGRQNVFDITGSKEIKMMPFGIGRRICPGLGVAMQNLEYFVANLIWRFEWTPVNGENVDLSEKIGLTTDLKSPLRVCISQRLH